MTTITHAGGAFTPTQVDGYEPSIQVRSIVHTILGRSDPDVTFRPSGMRTGTLSLVFAAQSDAWAAVAVLRVPQVLTLTDDDVAVVNMSFVVAPGDLRPTLDDATRTVWVLEVPFQEVAP